MQRIILSIVVSLVAFSSHSQLFINELMASNNYTIADEFGEYDDWIEIYNPTDQDVDMAGAWLSDDPGQLQDWQLPLDEPEHTVVPAGGFKLFWADNDTLQGGNHLGFTLSGGGEHVVLTLPNGEIIINSVQYFNQENDISYGRVSDGEMAWQFFNIPTPNATNVDVQPPVMDIHINEIQSENSTTHFDGALEFDPWIELYNPNDTQVNLAGYELVYNNGEETYVFPNDNPSATVIESNDFKIIWCDGEDFQGPKHANFTLAPSGSLSIVGFDGATQVEDVAYASPGIDLSWGSEIDGMDEYVNFDIPTPDVTNQMEFIQPETIFINEIMASNMTDTLDNYGQSEDWLEIYNPNEYPVDLSGYHLSDNYGGDTYEIPSTYPDSVTVPANGFLLFWVDDDSNQGVRHTNFKFTINGEEALILAPDSFTIADFITFPLQETDISYGREMDGGEPWVYFIPGETTPENSNEFTESVSEFDSKLQKIYPNPANHMVNLPNSFENIQVYSALGGMLMEKSRCNALDVSGLSPGVYVVIGDGQRLEPLIVR